MARKKILLAEDDLDDQNFFYDFLKHRGDIFIMDPVENGVEVFFFLDNIKEKNELPDLIILDQNMPKKNGLQTLQLLKESERYIHIPVMIYSTYTDEQLKKNSFQLGASAVVTKPTSKEEYNKMMDIFLRNISKSVKAV
jgi:CheY-like chemotaxis protein